MGHGSWSCHIQLMMDQQQNNAANIMVMDFYSLGGMVPYHRNLTESRSREI